MPGRLSKLPAVAPRARGARRGRRTVLAAILGAAMVVAGCVAPPPPPPQQARPPVQDGAPSEVSPDPAGRAGPARVAILVPESAEDAGAAALGRALADAARLARDSGGADRPVLAVYDTAGRPDLAAAAARKALREGADVILGPLFTDSTRAVGDAVAGQGVPVLAFSNDAAAAGGPIWITGSTPEAEARRIVAYADRQGLRPVGVFRPDTDYGARALAGARAAGGGLLAPVMSYERSFTGIERAAEGFARTARERGVAAVLLPGGGDELKTVASFLNYHRLDPERVRFLGLRKWNTRASFEEPALRGGWFVAPDPDRAEAFAARFFAATGREAPALAHLGYDAMRLAMRAGDGARGSQRITRRALLAAGGVEGALGPLRLRADQTADRALAVLEVGAGRFVLREPARLPVAGGS